MSHHHTPQSSAPRPSTDLDAGAFERNFGPAIEQHEPHCALHLLQARWQFTGLGPKPEATQALVAGRRAASLHHTTFSAWLDPKDWVEWSLPRGLARSDYPVLGNPRVRTWRQGLVNHHSFPNGESVDCHPLPPVLAIEAASKAVVHAPDGLDDPDPVKARARLEWLASARDLLRSCAWDRPIAVVTNDGRMLGDGKALERLVAPILPWRRFHYSYAANFAALGLDLLEDCLAIPDAEAVATYRDIMRPSLRTGDVQERLRAQHSARQVTKCFQNPLTLQTLYALRRAGSVRNTGSSSGDRAWDTNLATAGNGEIWHGTGKHPPRRIPHTEARRIAAQLVSSLLIKALGDELSLSRIGEAYLDALHPACEDVDMPLRWHGNWAARGADDAMAMDAWITRTFSKMKARPSRSRRG